MLMNREWDRQLNQESAVPGLFEYAKDTRKVVKREQRERGTTMLWQMWSKTTLDDGSVHEREWFTDAGGNEWVKVEEA